MGKGQATGSRVGNGQQGMVADACYLFPHS